MTQTYNIGGPAGSIRSLIKGIIAIAAVIGGLFLMAASAAVAFFLILGLLILAALIIAFIWAKAKLTGKPFGPKAYFKAHGFDFEADFDAASIKNPGAKPDDKPRAKYGPIIDAHQTPEGWSVDD